MPKMFVLSDIRKKIKKKYKKRKIAFIDCIGKCSAISFVYLGKKCKLFKGVRIINENAAHILAAILKQKTLWERIGSLSMSTKTTTTTNVINYKTQ